MLRLQPGSGNDEDIGTLLGITPLLESHSLTILASDERLPGMLDSFAGVRCSRSVAYVHIGAATRDFQ